MRSGRITVSEVAITSRFIESTSIRARAHDGYSR